MIEIDVETLVDNAILIGLFSRAELRQAREAADDGSVDSLTRSLMRKGLLTSWQRDRLLKGETSGFFFGQFKVLFHIAEGTFARVYRGARSDSGNPVAIKVLRRRFTSDAMAVARFAQEAEAGMRLVHPNIVRIYEYGEVDGQHFMVMEYVEGSNLRDFLKLRQRLDEKEALPILMGLAAGLQYSHDQHVTHRDIKGTNVLISTKREAKLVDFGLATVGDDRITEFAHTRTVDYSALERGCKSPKGDPRSDIYFMGTVFYQVLTGVLPLPEVEANDMLAKMLKRSFGAIKPLSEMRYAPGPELSRIVEKMMAWDLEKRYQTMGEVMTDLESLHSHATKGSPLPVARRPASDDDLFFAAFEKKSSFHKHIMCVEVQDTIQAAFKKSLTPMGYRVLVVRDAERAAERYTEAPPDAVVFDADGLGEEALDAFLAMHDKAHADGHDLSAVVLLGLKQGELASKLPADDRLIVLHKPIKMKDVQDAIAKLVPIET
jgi:serine/threonine protein kinase